MKKVLPIIPLFIIGLAVGIFGAILISGSAYSCYCTFSGTEKFQTEEEALNFQQKILDYADDNGYESDVTISKHSPPKVSYTIKVYNTSLSLIPYNTPLSLIPEADSDYGSRNFSKLKLILIYVLSGIILIGSPTGFLVAYFSRPEKELK